VNDPVKEKLAAFACDPTPTVATIDPAIASQDNNFKCDMTLSYAVAANPPSSCLLQTAPRSFDPNFRKMKVTYL
jgi:hypothetical protein